MNTFALFRSLNRDQRNTFLASFLGWTLDAFDFFLVSFVTLRIAGDFRVGLPAVVLTTSLTLAMRPVGALIFGILADRFGRRTPLMVDIVLYSVLELLTAFSPNYAIFLILRVLFGIAMGGEWGLGSSLAMETLPTESRGLFSGILQQGYACGYLLGAVAYYLIFTLFPGVGWRAMFIVGVLPALLVVFIRSRVPESPVWEHQQVLHRQRGINVWQGMLNAIKNRWILFVYLILLTNLVVQSRKIVRDGQEPFFQGTQNQEDPAFSHIQALAHQRLIYRLPLSRQHVQVSQDWQEYILSHD